MTKSILFRRQAPQVRKEKLLVHIKKNIWLYLFTLPALLVVLVFNYGAYWGNIMAFEDFDRLKGIFGSNFVGFENFKAVFTSPNFSSIFTNTISISLLGFVIGFPVPIIFALFLNELRLPRFKQAVQTVSYLPHFISWVIVASIMYQFLDVTGLVNSIIALFGSEKIQFFAQPKWFWIISVLIAVWKEIGWSSIIYLAAIAGIDQELYEAAVVDGAGRFKRMWHVTLSGIRPTIALLLILAAGALFTGGSGIAPGFDGIYNLSNSILLPKSETFDYWIYLEGIRRGSYSFTAAAGLMQAAVSVLLVFGANRIANKVGDLGIL